MTEKLPQSISELVFQFRNDNRKELLDILASNKLKGHEIILDVSSVDSGVLGEVVCEIKSFKKL